VSEVVLMKTPGGVLAPFDEEAARFIEKMKAGAGVRVKVTKIRNLPFHRKFFAMLDVGYDAWEPEEKVYKGMVARKNRKKFRGDMIILAGYFDAVINFNGDTQLKPKSISFANMEQDEFEKLYSEVANVLLQKVLKNYTRADLDETVERILGFV